MPNRRRVNRPVVYTLSVELKVILKEVLAMHDKWINTEGKEGTRLSVPQVTHFQKKCSWQLKC